MQPRTLFLAVVLLGVLPGALRADSLWQDTTEPHFSWFSDLKARRVGDILTILIKEESKATTDLGQSYTKGTDVSGSVTKLQNILGMVKPDPNDPTKDTPLEAGLPAVEWKGSRKTDAKATNESKEALELRIAAVVQEILPNGNLLIEGTREIRHGRDLRLIHVGGMVRPADIGLDNTVLSEHIAQARISYEGCGPTSRATNRGWFAHLVDFLWPF